MNLSIYVGPYLEVSREFDLYQSGFDDLVADGRMEAAEDGEPWYLIPNQKMLCVSRQMEYDRYQDVPVVAITQQEMGLEKAAFALLAEPIITACNERNIDIRLRWGIVPCWS